MLRAVGFSEDDFGKPQVAVVASSWNEVTPCNYHLDKLAALAKEGVRQGGSVPIEFGTIAISDGIAMGHEGMKASLMSRDLIADSVELVMHAERLDALVAIAGCDKSEPGMMMAIARLNLPSVYLPGTILPAPTTVATSRSRTSSRPSVRTPVIDDEELLRIERAACPTTGSCAGMYTANTMAAVGEAIGLSLPGGASPPAVDYRREVFARESGRRGRARPGRRGRCHGHPDEGGVRERDRGRDGARRVHERRVNRRIAREAEVDLQLDDFRPDSARRRRTSSTCGRRAGS